MNVLRALNHFVRIFPPFKDGVEEPDYKFLFLAVELKNLFETQRQRRRSPRPAATVG
jgi:hypothetical protein